VCQPKTAEGEVEEIVLQKSQENQVIDDLNASYIDGLMDVPDNIQLQDLNQPDLFEGTVASHNRLMDPFD